MGAGRYLPNNRLLGLDVMSILTTPDAPYPVSSVKFIGGSLVEVQGDMVIEIVTTPIEGEKDGRRERGCHWTEFGRKECNHINYVNTGPSLPRCQKNL